MFGVKQLDRPAPRPELSKGARPNTFRRNCQGQLRVRPYRLGIRAPISLILFWLDGSKSLQPGAKIMFSQEWRLFAAAYECRCNARAAAHTVRTRSAVSRSLMRTSFCKIYWMLTDFSFICNQKKKNVFFDKDNISVFLQKQMSFQTTKVLWPSVTRHPHHLTSPHPPPAPPLANINLLPPATTKLADTSCWRFHFPVPHRYIIQNVQPAPCHVN